MKLTKVARLFKQVEKINFVLGEMLDVLHKLECEKEAVQKPVKKKAKKQAKKK
jgi:hypothetical protein